MNKHYVGVKLLRKICKKLMLDPKLVRSIFIDAPRNGEVIVYVAEESPLGGMLTFHYPGGDIETESVKQA